MDKNPKTILITGAGGFLGRKLTDKLINEGHKVFVYTSQKNYFKMYEQNGIKIYGEEDWKQGQIPFASVDVLVNCAFARSSHGDKIAASIKFIDQFIYDAVTRGAKSVINISSQSVYDQKRIEPAKEQTEVKPETLYAMGKYATELLISKNCINMNIPYSNIRLGSLVGKEFDVRLTNRFAKNAINHETIIVKGGHQIISYLHINDTVDALSVMIRKEPEFWKKLYNLGASDHNELREIVKKLNLVFFNHFEQYVSYTIEEEGNFLNLSLDSSLFYNDFSWKPQYSIVDILEELFESD